MPPRHTSLQRRDALGLIRALCLLATVLLYSVSSQADDWIIEDQENYIAELCLSLDTALGYWLFKGFVFIYIVQPSGVDLNTAEMIDVRTTESEEFFIKSIENLIKS